MWAWVPACAGTNGKCCARRQQFSLEHPHAPPSQYRRTGLAPGRLVAPAAPCLRWRSRFCRRSCSRGDLFEIVPALATFGAALALAGLAILSRSGRAGRDLAAGTSGIGRAVAGFFIACALLAYPAYLGAQAYRLPAIHDITTDPVDRRASMRSRGCGRAAAIDYPGRRRRQLQRAGLSRHRAVRSRADAAAAYDAALAVVTKRKWRVVDARAPQAGTPRRPSSRRSRARRSWASATTW